MNENRIDLYSFLNVKKPPSDLMDRISVSLGWVPKEHRRRLDAYTILAAYTANVSNTVRNTPSGDLHEYGDANLVCTAMSSAVMGDKVRIFASKEDKAIEDFFTSWADKELFFAKMMANEYKASNLGDCVYILKYSKKRKRVVVTTRDPGYWFPFDIGKSTERHIIAWEIETDGGTEIYKEEYTLDGAKGGNQQVSLSAAYYSKGNGKSINDPGLKFIRWATDEDGNQLRKASLGIDFFPIVYIPNIYREGEDFGESDLTAVWRIFDELCNTYSDESKNAYKLGLAQMWVDMGAFEKAMPVDKDGNIVLKTGENNVLPGQAGVVDNSKLNDALMKYQDRLEAKLFNNTCLGPMVGMLATGSEDRTTGILQLKGSLLERFVDIKRMMRSPKYAKLLNFVARLELVHGEKETKKLFAGKENAARIQFGNVLPIDQKVLVSNLSQIHQRLSNNDMRDNLREGGIIVNEEIKDAPEKAQTTTGGK